MMAEEWLQNEDTNCYPGRLERLKWLIDIFPIEGVWLFHAGLLTKYLFEEARYCFVYGQFISTIVLGFSFIEHSLASIFYGSGQDRMERAKTADLIQEAFRQELIDHNEFQMLSKIRKLRNPIVHFRRPGDQESIEYKAVMENEHSYSLLEEDARFVMGIVMRLLGKFSEVI